MARFSNPFSKKTVSFLRSLKRNNDREWFRARRDQYEEHVREPMIAVVEQLAQDFRTVAPELIASPKQSLFRVYRDTRFSDNKKPLKTHAAAIFRTRDLPKPQGAGLYFEIAPGWVWIGGGMWRPEPPELVRIREHIAETWPEIRGIAASAAFRRRFEELSGDTMTRVPRGYRADHPAARVSSSTGSSTAAPSFPPRSRTAGSSTRPSSPTFKALMPLVRFLNEPLVEDGGKERPGLKAGPHGW